MNCRDCEHFKCEVISLMDTDNVNTDLGFRILKCYKLINYLITKDDYTNVKYTGPKGIIGFTKEFDYKGKHEMMLGFLPLNVIEKVETPKWCPLNK